MANHHDGDPVRVIANHLFPLVPQDLKERGALCTLMDCLLAEDASVEKFYRKSVHQGIIRRYRAARLLYDDAELFALWRKEPLILGLPRAPQCKDDILVAFLRATYADPSKASKYFKRVEHIWDEKKPAEDVAKFLKVYGLTKPVPGVFANKKPKIGDEADDDNGNADVDDCNDENDTADDSTPAPIERRVSLKTSTSGHIRSEGPRGSASDIPDDWEGDVDDMVVMRVKITSRDDGSLTYDILGIKPG